MKTIGLMKALALCGQYRNASPERRTAIQEQRLRELVRYARTHSPYYARLYAGVVQNGGDHRLVPHQLSVPARRQPVEEGLYVTLVYHGARPQRKKAAVSICW